MCVCTLHPSINVYLGCFLILAITHNSAVMYLDAYGTDLCELVFSFSLDKYPQLKLLGHMVIKIFFLWNLHTILYSCCTNKHFQQQYTRVPFSSHPYQHSFLVHSDRSELFDYSSNFYFPCDYLIMHLDICVCSLRKCLCIHIFCSFFNFTLFCY